MSILIYLATIFWSLFPNLIHVFQGGDDFINKVNEANLVSNSDLKLDTNNDNVPDGFAYAGATNYSLVDGIATFTPTIQLGRIQQYINYPDNSIIYYFANVKTTSLKVGVGNNYFVSSYHNGNNNYQLLSVLYKNNPTTETIKIVSLRDDNISDFVSIEVDYIGAYNVSTMINNGVKSDDGIFFSDLNNEQIRTQLDIWIAEHGDLSFTITKDNTYDSWFNTGFVEKTAERDFLDYLGYFVWLMTPPILLFITLDMIRRLI